MTGALNRNRQLTLMARASAGYSAGQNLCSLRDKAAQFCDILVINGLDLIYAEAVKAFLRPLRPPGRRLSRSGLSPYAIIGNLLFSVFSVKWN